MIILTPSAREELLAIARRYEDEEAKGARLDHCVEGFLEVLAENETITDIVIALVDHGWDYTNTINLALDLVAYDDGEGSPRIAAFVANLPSTVKGAIVAAVQTEPPAV